MEPCNNDIELLFEFHEREKGGRHLRFTKPVKIITACQTAEVIPALSDVCNAVKKGLYAAGFLSYEAAPAFDSAYRIRTNSNMPLLWFGLFAAPEIIEPTGQSYEGSFKIGDWEPNVCRADYNQCIAKIKSEIEKGNTYQVNYTIRMQADFQGDDFAYYKRLSQSQEGQFSSYLNIGRHRILSASPELFFRLEKNTITTQPMKGTARRGLNVIDDEEQRQILSASEKNQAENVMIVDLLRNDLGRIAEMGSVRVAKLFEIDKYPTVFQMTSTIQAKVRPGTTLVDIFRALFPCGSITGAPKISTMKIIAGLERAPREVYCGAIGYVSPDGDASFSVPIRTVVLDGDLNTAWYGVGGGITWDSTPEEEYDEIITKAALLHADRIKFDLLETMLLDNGTYTYLERHLNRLESSAEYFNYPFVKNDILKELDEHIKLYPSEPRRVRLLLSENGKFSIESVPFMPLSTQTIKTAALADAAIDRTNRFLYHKTTNRGIYNKHKNANPDVFDILLWNENREITEFTIGNIVVELNGLKITPPVSCGLLPGVFREELLARGDIVERIVTLQDLLHATNVWLINSLQGWIPIHVNRVKEC
jgi:para-aminobenzoate synthetase/4-amino-4-deoxychorismate lyase